MLETHLLPELDRMGGGTAGGKFQHGTHVANGQKDVCDGP